MEALFKFTKRINISSKFKIAIEIFLCLLLCVIISAIIDRTVWIQSKGHIHTILELICIIIGISAFLTFWNTSKYQANLNYILTFGFLITSVFDGLHAYFFNDLNLYPTGYYDLYVRFYLLARIVEVFVLMFGVKPAKKNRMNKTLALLISLFIILSSIFVLFKFPNILPRFATPSLGVTPAKIYSEYMLIFFYLIIMYRLITRYNNRDLVSFKYLFIALSLAIPTEICFSLYASQCSFYFVCGHFLRIICYFYIYKGIFVNAVTRPYKELKRIMSEDKIRDAFDYVNIGIALADLDANIISVNKHLCLMLGYTEDELLGMSFGDITYPDDKYTDRETIARLYKLKVPKINFEKRCIHKLGHIVWVSVTDTFVNDKNNNPLYVVTEYQDISSQKKIVELEKKIETDKRALEETLELDKLRTEFFANLSHELRTPLNVIIGASQLTDFYINQDGANSLDHVIKNNRSIKQNSRRLVRLVNNLIDSTKIDSGLFQLKSNNYNIVSIIEDITLSVVEYTNSKGIQLLFDTDIEEKIIACDPDKIERIMLNLLSNAIKFTPKNGRIYVNIFDANSNIIISVKDTGIGIPRDKQTVIFERFRQVDKSFTRNQEGSGIGLSLVKSLVELHEGKIELISSENLGSEFIITLPCTKVEESTEAPIPYRSYDRVERVHVEFSDIYN